MKKTISAVLALVLCLQLCACAVAQSGEEEQIIDLDLSKMSGTMVYAQIYQMIIEPEAYVGKVVRVSGLFGAMEDDITGMVYTACVVPDATACCAQGIEFVWKGEHPYPEAYPELGSELMVTGRFETYMEGENMFIHLVDADVNWGA